MEAFTTTLTIFMKKEPRPCATDNFLEFDLGIFEVKLW